MTETAQALPGHDGEPSPETGLEYPDTASGDELGRPVGDAKAPSRGSTIPR